MEGSLGTGREDGANGGGEKISRYARGDVLRMSTGLDRSTVRVARALNGRDLETKSSFLGLMAPLNGCGGTVLTGTMRGEAEVSAGEREVIVDRKDDPNVNRE